MNPQITPREKETFDAFVDRIPSEQIGWAHKFPSPNNKDREMARQKRDLENRDNAGKPRSRGEGTAATPPPKAGGTGSKSSAPTGADRDPPLIPLKGETFDEFNRRMTPDQREYAYNNFPSPNNKDREIARLKRDIENREFARQNRDIERQTRDMARQTRDMARLNRDIDRLNRDFTRKPRSRGEGMAATPPPKAGRPAPPARSDEQLDGLFQRFEALKPPKENLDDLFQRFEALKPPKENPDSLFQRFEALKDMGPPRSKTPPPKN